MCSADLSCYTITNETGFYETEKQCRAGIYELITRPDFPALYMYLDENLPPYKITGVKCINWDEKAT